MPRTCSPAACVAPVIVCGSTRSLIDTRTDFPLWSERYDREMEDVFEVQDEIARKIAEALRITLSPQEQRALAVKPTENLQAYDLYLRGKSHARRLTRQDLELPCRCSKNAVALDPQFALAYAAIANVCAQYHYHYEPDRVWMERAKRRPSRRRRCNPVPEAQMARAWVLYAERKYHEEAVRDAGEASSAEAGLRRAATICSAAPCSPPADTRSRGHRGNRGPSRRRRLQRLSRSRMRSARSARRNAERTSASGGSQALERHIKRVPEDVRARIRARHRFLQG